MSETEARQYWEDILVSAVEQFDGMREGAVLAVLVDAQVPDDGGKEDDRTLHEEVALLLHPRLVEVEHDGIGTLVGIRNVAHEVRMDRIAAVTPARVVEVDDVELRFYLVALLMAHHMVVGNLPSW